KQRLDGVEDHASGPHRPNRVVEPDEQPFEVVFTRFLDLAALDPDVVDGELLRTNQMRKVEPERGDVAGHFAGVLLEGHEDARLVEAPDAGGTLRQAVSESGIGEKGEIGLLLHGASPVSVRT